MQTSPSKQLETFPNPTPGRDYEIRFECPEFTCLCPRTGQPDFATFRIRYVPDQACVAAGAGVDRVGHQCPLRTQRLAECTQIWRWARRVAETEGVLPAGGGAVVSARRSKRGVAAQAGPPGWRRCIRGSSTRWHARV